MDPADLLTWGTAILALASLAGLGIQRTRVQTLTADLAAADRRVDVARQDLDRDRIERARYEKEMTQKLAGQETKIAKLVSDLEHANSLATGAMHWQALDEHLDHHHREAMTQWGVQSTRLADVKDGIDAVRDALTKRGRRGDDLQEPQ